VALVGNRVRLGNSNPLRVMFGAGAHSQNRANWGTPGSIRNFYAGPGTVSGGASTANKSGFPDGCRPPICWVLPIKAGGMASRFEVNGEGSISSANLAGGLYGVSTIAGVATFTAAGSLVIAGSATLAGTSSFTADIVGSLNAEATLAGTSSLAGALTGVGNMVADLQGTGSVSSAVLTGVGSMSATIEIGATTELTAAQIAAEVWNSLVVAYENGDGTMGRALIDIFRLMGLDPTRSLVVTKSGDTVTAVDAGPEIHQDVTETPTETTATRS